MRRPPPDCEENDDGKRAAESCAFECRPEEMPLELARDEVLIGADKMQHLDDVSIAGHGAARREDDGQHRCCNHERENCRTDENRRTRHGNQPVDPVAVIVETGARNLLDQRSANGGEIRRGG